MARQHGGWNPLIGIGFTALGVGYLYEAWKHANGATIPAVPATSVNGNRGALGYAGGRGDPLVLKDGVKTIRFYPAGDISQRVGYIAAQMRKDAEDKDVVTEARRLLSGKCPVERGGVDWCIQPKHWKEEILQLFNAVTNPNSAIAMRYTRDPLKYDAFGSSALHRRLPAGDCFVHGTLVLRDDHTLVPVESLKVGDRIWGLDKWTRVEQTWDKGVLPTWLIKLNNGSSMRLTPDHKVWVLVCEKHPTGSNCAQNTCPLSGRTKKVVRVHQLTKNMTLIQPDAIDAGLREIDPEDAVPAAKELVEGVMADSGASAHSGRCFTTTSRTLFMQTRILLKTQGVSCTERFVPNHGGLGKNPVWRLQERLKAEDRERGVKVLRVKAIVKDDIELPCFDFATEDKHIWLPEADWTVHNCDDMVIRLGALLMAVGYPVKCRVVAPAGQPGQWAHIYLAVGDEPGNEAASKWYAIDPTEPQNGAFWEVPDRVISSKRDFPV